MDIHFMRYYDTRMGFFHNQNRIQSSQNDKTDGDIEDEVEGERAFLIRPIHTERVAEMTLIPKFVDGHLMSAYWIGKGKKTDLVSSHLHTYLEVMYANGDNEKADMAEKAVTDGPGSDGAYKDLESFKLSHRDIARHTLSSGDVLFIAKGQHAGVMCFIHPADFNKINNFNYDTNDRDEMTLADELSYGKYIAHSTFYVFRPKVDKKYKIKYGQALATWLASTVGREKISGVLNHGTTQMPVPWRISLKELQAITLPETWSENVERLSAAGHAETSWYVRNLILRAHYTKITDENVRRIIHSPRQTKQPYLFSEEKALEVTIEELLTRNLRTFEEPKSLCINGEDLEAWNEGVAIMRSYFKPKIEELLMMAHNNYGDYISYIPNVKDSSDAIFQLLSFMSIEMGCNIKYDTGSIIYDTLNKIKKSIYEDGMITDGNAISINDRSYFNGHVDHYEQDDKNKLIMNKKWATKAINDVYMKESHLETTSDEQKKVTPFIQELEALINQAQVIIRSLKEVED